MHQAKTHLSRLVEQALAGEEIVIARRDRGLVRLTPIPPVDPGRKVGGMPGLVVAMGDHFNAPMEDWDPAVEPAANPVRPGVRRKRRSVPDA